jgi:nitrate reductase alpha subunit
MPGESIVEDPAKAQSYKSHAAGWAALSVASWTEVNEIIAAANVYTAKQYGPDRVVTGFSPIPAMSMVSYAAGARYLSLIGGNCLSFYDWYCDLPPASPHGLGRADRRARIRRLVQLELHHRAWGSNVPQTRTPDAHFLTEVRYKGAKTCRGNFRTIPKASKFDRHSGWLPNRAPTPRLAQAIGACHPERVSPVEQPSAYFHRLSCAVIPVTSRCWSCWKIQQ